MSCDSTQGSCDLSCDSQEDETATLLHALQMKAAAFSDAGWLEYWNNIAHSLLAQGWKSVYPHITYNKLESVTGLTFLMNAGESEEVSGDEELEMNEIMRATEALDITSVDNSTVAMETTNQTTKLCNESHDMTPPTDDQIKKMWLEFYNSYYWYCYQRWLEKKDETDGDSGLCKREEEIEDKEEGTAELVSGTCIT